MEKIIVPESLKSRQIDLAKDYPEIEFFLKKDGVGCASKGDIIAVKAKAKQGKTLSFACFITALVRGDYMGFLATKEGLRVLYIDTEQNPLNTAKFAKKVHSLCGFSLHKNSPQFTAINLRGDAPQERCDLLSQAVEVFSPDVVFLDGVKDLVLSDINSQEESGKVIQLLMTLTKEHPICLFTVLHENKNDQNLRGAIGTELLNKCSECWQVKKDGIEFLAEQTESRNAPVDGFGFLLDGDGLPTPINVEPKMSTSEKNAQKKIETLKMCLNIHAEKSYTKLIEDYSEFGGCKEKTAQTHIAFATKKGWLSKNIKTGNYTLNYIKLP